MSSTILINSNPPQLHLEGPPPIYHPPPPQSGDPGTGWWCCDLTASGDLRCPVSSVAQLRRTLVTVFSASTSTSYRSWTRSISTMAHLLEDNVFFCPCTHKPLQTYAFTFVLNPNFGPKTPTLSEWVYIVHTRIVHFQTSNTLTFTANPYAVIVLAYRSGFLTKLWGGHRLGALGHSRLLSQERGGLPLHYDASFKMSLYNLWSTFLLPGKEAQIWNGKQIFEPFHFTGHFTLYSCVHCQN